MEFDVANWGRRRRRRRRRRRWWKRRRIMEKSVYHLPLYYQSLSLAVRAVCSASSFVNIKYKWAFHRILYRMRQYNTAQHNTLHTHPPTYSHTYIITKVWVRHSFLKYKWAVNNVMMLSCSIYSYMICWLGFYLCGPFFWCTLIWASQLRYNTHNNCYTFSKQDALSRIHFHELEHHVNV